MLFRKSIDKILKGFAKKNNEARKIYMIDIDGTICDDIPNEQAHRFNDAKRYDEAHKIINGWHRQGHSINFITARTEEHRGVTEQWLRNNGFPYESLLFGKPRIKDGEEYHYIDNRPIKATKFLDKFREFKSKLKKVETMEK